MEEFKLFMVLIGCRPKGRNTEQHDVYFGIAKELRDLIPEMRDFWKGTSPLHVDGWRIVRNVDGYRITVVENFHSPKNMSPNLFFLNLGGYKENHFEEFHYKMLTVAADKAVAAKNAKSTAFYLHTGFSKVAAAHIDDKYGVDVDDLFEIKDILSENAKQKFSVLAEKAAENTLPADEMTLGFFKFDRL